MDFFAFDDDYVRRLREGDRWTEEHFARYFGVLFRAKLRGRLRPGIDVEDVTQEVFRRVLENLRRGAGVREGQKFGGYVNAICNNVVSELARRDHHDEPLVDDVQSRDDIFADLVTAETKTRVDRALAALAKEAPRDATILRDLFLDELDKDAVCRKHGVDRNYLRVLVYRALEKFRGKFDDR
jgi:RNA polymerase sigma-70 factor, ECF subfamily